MSPGGGGPMRVLVVAHQTFSVADARLEDLADVETVEVIHRTGAVNEALARSRANVALIDTGFADGRGFGAIASALAHDPDLTVLALTPDPPTSDSVARATNAGARGFVDVNAEPAEFEQALQAVHAGGLWFPPAESWALFGEQGEQLETMGQEHRSRLFGLALGLVPITGAIAALLTYAWRQYLGQIGVRPIDLAVDPGSRVVDVLSNVLLFLGVFGPLLFVSSWLALLRDSSVDRGAVAWLLRRPAVAWVVVASCWLTLSLLLVEGPDVFQRLVVGPVVAIALLAWAMGLDDELPEILRPRELKPRRVLIGGGAALILFFGIMVFEAQMVGPDLRTDGAHGLLAPRLLGFTAQPVRVIDLDPGGPPQDLLYLGGNADLYVLVDPCDDDTVKLVSVGRHQLEVIEEVDCGPGTSS